MDTYDNRGVTLDSGLTALALRGLHEREGHYPFIDRYTGRRRRARRRAASPSPRRFGAALLSLLTLRRLWAPHRGAAA